MTTTTLAMAAAAIPGRLKALAVRPAGVTVAALIDRFMAAYAGRDPTLCTHLQAWRALIGDFALEDVDNDLIHAARSELANLPALAFKGLDHEGRKIFKPKTRQRTKGPATINRYMASLGTLFTWSIEQRMTPRKWVHPCRGVRRMPEPQGRVRFLDAEERERSLRRVQGSAVPTALRDGPDGNGDRGQTRRAARAAVGRCQPRPGRRAARANEERRSANSRATAAGGQHTTAVRIERRSPLRVRCREDGLSDACEHRHRLDRSAGAGRHQRLPLPRSATLLRELSSARRRASQCHRGGARAPQARHDAPIRSSHDSNQGKRNAGSAWGDRLMKYRRLKGRARWPLLLDEIQAAKFMGASYLADPTPWRLLQCFSMFVKGGLTPPSAVLMRLAEGVADYVDSFGDVPLEKALRLRAAGPGKDAAAEAAAVRRRDLENMKEMVQLRSFGATLEQAAELVASRAPPPSTWPQAQRQSGTKALLDRYRNWEARDHYERLNASMPEVPRHEAALWLARRYPTHIAATFMHDERKAAERKVKGGF